MYRSLTAPMLAISLTSVCTHHNCVNFYVTYIHSDGPGTCKSVFSWKTRTIEKINITFFVGNLMLSNHDRLHFAIRLTIYPLCSLLEINISKFSTNCHHFVTIQYCKIKLGLCVN